VPNKLSSKQFSDFRNIPAELATPSAWIPWYWRAHGDKRQKSPITKYTGANRANCRPLGELLAKGNVRDGFSKVLDADGFVVIDLDHGRDAKTGTIEPWARVIVDALDTYTEISYSGSGLHLVCGGGPLSHDWSPNPKDAARKGAPQIEIYSGNIPNKLMSFTGDVFENRRVIRDCQAAAATLLEVEMKKFATAPAPEQESLETLLDLPDAERPVYVDQCTWVGRHIPTIGELPRTPIIWVVDRMIPYKGVSMITGSKGSYKSFLAARLAQAVAGSPFGETTLGWDTEPAHDGEYPNQPSGEKFPGVRVIGEFPRPRRPQRRTFSGREIQYGAPVLYLDRENHESIVGVRSAEAGIIGNRRFYYWTESHNGMETEIPDQPDDPKLLEWAKQNNGFVIFDSLQDWYGSRSEVDNSEMLDLMRRFKKLARAGAGVLILHHLSIGGEKARGCTAITNTPDMVFMATKNKANPEQTKLTEDRFRCTGPWEIRDRVNWNAGEIDGQRIVKLELVEDLDGEKLAEIRAEAKEEKETEKEADAAKELETVRQMKSEGKSVWAIRKATGMGFKKATELYEKS
jgi:hypothetical protein